MPTIHNPNDPVGFGKHCLRSLLWIFKNRHDYYMWMCSQGMIPASVHEAVISPKDVNKPKQPKKEKIMSKSKAIKGNLKQESLDNVQLQIGKLIYTTVAPIVETHVLKLGFFSKLFSTKAKRDTAVLVALYGLLHLARTKYDHYALQCLTRYINHEMQTTVVGAMLPADALVKLFSLPTKSDA